MARTRKLPGMEDEAHEDVRDVALLLFGLRDEKKALKAKEDDAVEKLLAVMEEHGIRHYYDEERRLLVEVEEKEKVKVTMKRGGKAGDEEDEE